MTTRAGEDLQLLGLSRQRHLGQLEGSDLATLPSGERTQGRDDNGARSREPDLTGNVGGGAQENALDRHGGRRGEAIHETLQGRGRQPW